MSAQKIITLLGATACWWLGVRFLGDGDFGLRVSAMDGSTAETGVAVAVEGVR